MTQRNSRVELSELVAAAIGRKLPELGFVNVTWLGGEVYAQHASGDEIRVRVSDVDKGDSGGA